MDLILEVFGAEDGGVSYMILLSLARDLDRSEDEPSQKLSREKLREVFRRFAGLCEVAKKRRHE